MRRYCLRLMRTCQTRLRPGVGNTAVFAAIVVLAATWQMCGGTLLAAPQSGGNRTELFQASSSPSVQRAAVAAIPMDKLDETSRAKVRSVLDDVTLFRRMPVRVIECDPNLYLFLLRHPDVLVNIWEVLKISQLRLRETGSDQYQLHESPGTVIRAEYLYRSHDLHVVYCEGTYEGPLFKRSIKGRGLLVLRSGYVRETDGRYYITNRLDSFVQIEPGAVELLTKTVQPLVGRTADFNFIQTVGFVGSLSRTAEVNGPGLQRLAGRLAHVQPEVRERFAELAAEVARKSPVSSRAPGAAAAQVASRDSGTK